MRTILRNNNSLNGTLQDDSTIIMSLQKQQHHQQFEEQEKQQQDKLCQDEEEEKYLCELKPTIITPPSLMYLPSQMGMSTLPHVSESRNNNRHPSFVRNKNHPSQQQQQNHSTMRLLSYPKNLCCRLQHPIRSVLLSLLFVLYSFHNPTTSCMPLMVSAQGPTTPVRAPNFGYLPCGICNRGELLMEPGTIVPAGTIPFITDDIQCIRLEQQAQNAEFSPTQCIQMRRTTAPEICGCAIPPTRPPATRTPIATPTTTTKTDKPVSKPISKPITKTAEPSPGTVATTEPTGPVVNETSTPTIAPTTVQVLSEYPSNVPTLVPTITNDTVATGVPTSLGTTEPTSSSNNTDTLVPVSGLVLVQLQSVATEMPNTTISTYENVLSTYLDYNYFQYGQPPVSNGTCLLINQTLVVGTFLDPNNSSIGSTPSRYLQETLNNSSDLYPLDTLLECSGYYPAGAFDAADPEQMQEKFVTFVIFGINNGTEKLIAALQDATSGGADSTYFASVTTIIASNPDNFTTSQPSAPSTPSVPTSPSAPSVPSPTPPKYIQVTGVATIQLVTVVSNMSQSNIEFFNNEMKIFLGQLWADEGILNINTNVTSQKLTVATANNSTNSGSNTSSSSGNNATRYRERRQRQRSLQGTNTGNYILDIVNSVSGLVQPDSPYVTSGLNALLVQTLGQNEAILINQLQTTDDPTNAEYFSTVNKIAAAPGPVTLAPVPSPIAPPSDKSGTKDSGLNTSAIAGIVVGIGAVFLLVVGLNAYSNHKKKSEIPASSRHGSNYNNDISATAGATGAGTASSRPNASSTATTAVGGGRGGSGTAGSTLAQSTTTTASRPPTSSTTTTGSAKPLSSSQAPEKAEPAPFRRSNAPSTSSGGTGTTSVPATTTTANGDAAAKAAAAGAAGGVAVGAAAGVAAANNRNNNNNSRQQTESLKQQQSVSAPASDPSTSIFAKKTPSASATASGSSAALNSSTTNNNAASDPTNVFQKKSSLTAAAAAASASSPPPGGRSSSPLRSSTAAAAASPASASSPYKPPPQTIPTASTNTTNTAAVATGAAAGGAAVGAAAGYSARQQQQQQQSSSVRPGQSARPTSSATAATSSLESSTPGQQQQQQASAAASVSAYSTASTYQPASYKDDDNSLIEQQTLGGGVSEYGGNDAMSYAYSLDAGNVDGGNTFVGGGTISGSSYQPGGGGGSSRYSDTGGGTTATGTQSGDDVSSHAMSSLRQNMVSRTVIAPPGKLGIVIDTTLEGPVVHKVNPQSPLEGSLFPGDIIVAIDDVDTRAMSASAITALMVRTANLRRKLTVLSEDITN